MTENITHFDADCEVIQ